MKRFSTILLLFVSLILSVNKINAQAPSEAASTPPLRPLSKVISVFSDAYTNVPGTIFNPNWQQATTYTAVTVAGNAAIKYATLNWQGMELGQDINALPMTHLHVDIWTSNETSLTISPISRTTGEYLVSLAPLTLNSWNSFDVPLTAFTDNGISMADIFQFKLVGAGGHTIYLDNLYFYNENQEEDIEGPVDFTVNSGLVTFSSIELLLNATDASGAVFYEIKTGATTVNVTAQSGVEKSYTFTSLSNSTKFNFTVKAKDYAGNEALNNPVSISVTTLDSPPAAPTPPARAANKVISFFSDAYTNIPGTTNFYPYWQQTTVASMVEFQGNPTLKYENFNYMGIELGSDINALPMTHFHVDVYTTDETSLQLAPISRSAKNSNVTAPPLMQNEWNSIDINLSDISSSWVSIADIFQFFLQGSGGTTVYVDNMYFYNNSTTEDTETPTAFTATKGLVTFSSVELLLKASDNSGAVVFDISYGNKTVTVGGSSGKSKSVIINELSGNTLYNFSVSAKDPSGNAAPNSPIVVPVTTQVAVTAPTPRVSASNVISIFSDTYTSVAGTNFNPNWSQTTVVTNIKVDGNTIMSYSNLNYQGIELGSHVNASSMNYLHVDVWTANETSLQVTPISPGKEKLVALTPLRKNQWNSYNIPLSSFTGVNMADVFQFKFVGSGGKGVLIDNLYFLKGSITAVNPQTSTDLKIFPNPASDVLNINSGDFIRDLEIYSVSGSLLNKINVEGFEKTIDLSGFERGSYFIRLNFRDGKIANEKFIKY